MITDEEAARLREAKAEVTQWLASVRLADYNLSRVDARLSAYVREVAGNPGGHNLYEQLGVRRFLQMAEKYGLRNDKINQFFTLYEGLYFPGKKGMTRYKLTPVQAFQFASIFGFWKGSRRVVREACLFVPRKFSKTTGTASLAVYDLLFGDSNGEAYVGANSQDQAKKCFNVIRSCMAKLDPTGRRYIINQDVIKSARADRESIAQCLTSGARTKDGLNASTIIMDEFSQARDSDLLTVLTTSMGVRDNPLTVIITTASDVFDGPFYDMLQGYKQVLLGDFEDDSLFAHLFEPDIDDAEDDPATWRKVHPHLGITVNDDFYEQEYRKAKRQGAEAMLAFRTKLLNVYSESEKKSWIPAAKIRSSMRHIDPRTVKGYPMAMVGIDLSVHDDFSCVSISYYDKKDSSLLFHTKYFFPEGALVGHSNEKLYRVWHEKGYLTLTRGETMDYGAIAEYVVELTETANIQGIGFDRYKAQQLINDLMAHPDLPGAESVITDIPQNYGAFTAAVEAFKHGIYEGVIHVDDNPINAYCFGNAVLDFDKMENCKPIKRQKNGNLKIDGVITKLMCMRQWLDLEQTPTIDE